jgi:N-methylhydantoinase B
MPERVIAASNGANTSLIFSGVAPDGQSYVYMETVGGGGGARSYKDGTDGVQVHVTNTSNLPIEVLEREYPILIERYEYVQGSAGAGRWRGGLGLRRTYLPLDHECWFSGQGERFVHQPWGLFGGEPGQLGRFQLLNSAGKAVDLPPKPSSTMIPKGGRLTIETPGAGGYGEAKHRDPDLRDQDIRYGKCLARAPFTQQSETSESLRKSI